jgi:hypothetical protein
MGKSSKRPGRPTKKPKAGERVPLGLRVTADIKRKLDGAAEKAGRSQSQEAELRLERSFDHDDIFGGAELRSRAISMAIAFRNGGSNWARNTDIKGDWIADADCYRSAIMAVLEDLIEAMPAGTDNPDKVAVWFEGLKSRLMSNELARQRRKAQS